MPLAIWKLFVIGVLLSSCRSQLTTNIVKQNPGEPHSDADGRRDSPPSTQGVSDIEEQNESPTEEAEDIEVVDNLPRGDVTPPSMPSGLDDGVRSSSLSQTPVITWNESDDADSGLSHYEIALGTSPGFLDIAGFTDVGLVTSYQFTTPLPNAQTVYASIRAVDMAGNRSQVLIGDGFQNLNCSEAVIGEPGFIKVVGNETQGLGGVQYDSGTKTLLDWASADSGNGWTPGKAIRQIADFCVMKYEAKLYHEDAPGDKIIVSPGINIPAIYDFESDYGSAEEDKYKARSVPQGRPWVTIKSGLNGTIGAAQVCENLGAGFRLINNAQWQSIARDIESLASNWDDGGTPAIADDDLLNRGHSDRFYLGPDDARVADADDANGCFALGDWTFNNGIPGDDCGGGWHFNKRTHNLSSSNEPIWDFSGNGREWVADLNHKTDGFGAGGSEADGYISVEPFVGSDPYQRNSNKNAWGALGDHSGKTGFHYGGLGAFYDDPTPGGNSDPSDPGGIIRGASWGDTADAGIFYVNLEHLPDYISDELGFRCTFAP